MIHSGKITSLLCVECNVRGTAIWNNDPGAPDCRHSASPDVSRGFKMVDRGPRLGRHFICVLCNRLAKEF